MIRSAAAVPVSLLTTLFLMHLGGQSLNVMTLGGLALGAGMLVDNAIVVVESIFRRLAGGEPPEVVSFCAISVAIFLDQRRGKRGTDG